MPPQTPKISKAFQAFQNDAPDHAAAWRTMVGELAHASALDPKTRELAFIAVLAVQQLLSGIAFHVKTAKQLGATREEVISAVLIGLPAAGHTVTQALPAAIEAYDEE